MCKGKILSTWVFPQISHLRHILGHQPFAVGYRKSQPSPYKRVTNLFTHKGNHIVLIFAPHGIHEGFSSCLIGARIGAKEVFHER